MKKKIIAAAVCLCLLAVGAFAYSNLNNLNKADGDDGFRQIGEGLREPVNSLLGGAASEEENMGEVLGVKISKKYFEVRYASYKSSPLNYENPRDAAWESIVEEIWERQFAEENGLLPTTEEIEAYVENNRAAFDSTEEGKLLIKSLYEGMGLTEDEYWQYHKEYQAPLALIHGRVNEFLEENKMEKPDCGSISSEILDNDYFDGLI